MNVLNRNKMGINIMAYILGNTVKVEDMCGEYEYTESKSYKDFDSLRHVGDRDFINTDQIEWEWKFEGEERSYRRPKDIDKAILFINDTIHSDRLVALMNEMKRNSNLWIYVSY
jgi:hypothetical protein